MKKIEFQVQLTILRPVSEVFDAVISPDKLSTYFTTAGANKPLKEGAEVLWKFGEVPDLDVTVSVKKIVTNEIIQFEWESGEGGYNTLVSMKFESLDAQTTLVQISESGWRDTEAGIKYSYSNCQGWMQMLCCLKAYVEYGINLRQGAFAKEGMCEPEY